jgi:hypothetical protein
MTGDQARHTTEVEAVALRRAIAKIIRKLDAGNADAALETALRAKATSNGHRKARRELATCDLTPESYDAEYRRRAAAALRRAAAALERTADDLTSAEAQALMVEAS